MIAVNKIIQKINKKNKKKRKDTITTNRPKDEYGLPRIQLSKNYNPNEEPTSSKERRRKNRDTKNAKLLEMKPEILKEKQERADYAEKHRISDQDLQIINNLPEIHQNWLQERKTFNNEFNELISKKNELEQIQKEIAKEKEQQKLKKLIEFHKGNAEKNEAKQTAELENTEKGYRRDIFGFEEILKQGITNVKGFRVTNSIKQFFTDEPTPNIKISDPRTKNKQHHSPDLNILNYDQNEQMNQE